MKPLKLIIEEDFHDFDLIIEQRNPNEPKFIRVKGPYLVANKKNANERLYKKHILEKAVEDFTDKMIKSGRALGELNHPAHTNIDPKQVCHRIESLKWDNDKCIGESLVLASSADGKIKGTPNGDILASILQHGGKPGMSSRGVGEIGKGGVIDKEYALCTIDCVTDPSGPGCFVDGILESKSFMVNTHGEIIECAYDIYENSLSDLPKHDKDKYIYECFTDFIKNINNINIK